MGRLKERPHCLTCGKEIGLRKKYCNLECYASAKSVMMRTKANLKCEGCGKDFYPRKSTLAHKDSNKFCSRSCSDSHRPWKIDFHIWFKTCVQCGRSFPTRNKSVVACSAECRLKRNAKLSHSRADKQQSKSGRIHRCKECGSEFIPKYGSKRRAFCGLGCSKRHGNRVSRLLRRAKESSAKVESVNPITVFERAGWVCYLCGGSTPRGLRGTLDHNAPELDHIIPLALGGEHSYANTACACRKCNHEKGSELLSRTPR